MKVPVIVLPCEACPRSLAIVLRSLRQQQKSVGFCTLLQTALTFDYGIKETVLLSVASKSAARRKTVCVLRWSCTTCSRLLFSPPFNLRRSDWPSVFQRAVRERDKCGLGENHPPAPSIWAELTLTFLTSPSFSCQGHNSSADRLALIVFFASYFACIPFLHPSSLWTERNIGDVLFHRSRSQASAQSREY
jgi:hypothetical protein